MKKKIVLLFNVLFALFFLVSCNETMITKKKPNGVQFHKETLRRVGNSGDNWCITWASDNSQITSLCDGVWLDDGKGYHNHLFRLTGEPDNFERENIIDYPYFNGLEGSWYGYGVLAVDGNIYSAASYTIMQTEPETSWTGPFQGVKLLKSPDNGKTWYRVDRNGNEKKYDGPNDSTRNIVNDEEMFFYQEFGLKHKEKVAYPFSYFDFVQCGRDNSAAKDNYIYIYSPEGAFSYKMLLAKVPKDKIGVRSEWEYFTKYDETNQPQWTKNIEERGYAYVFPEKSSRGHYFGWYSWLPSVVWNEGLGLYIMVNGGTYAGEKELSNSDKDYFDPWMHTESGSLGFWYSEKPYGPWKQFYYNEYFTVDNDRNRVYQPKLSPKWISEDGTKMVLIWSDAGLNEKGESHSEFYTWNQMEISIEIE